MHDAESSMLVHEASRRLRREASPGASSPRIADSILESLSKVAINTNLIRAGFGADEHEVRYSCVLPHYLFSSRRPTAVLIRSPSGRLLWSSLFPPFAEIHPLYYAVLDVNREVGTFPRDELSIDEFGKATALFNVSVIQFNVDRDYFAYLHGFAVDGPVVLHQQVVRIARDSEKIGSKHAISDSLLNPIVDGSAIQCGVETVRYLDGEQDDWMEVEVLTVRVFEDRLRVHGLSVEELRGLIFEVMGHDGKVVAQAKYACLYDNHGRARTLGDNKVMLLLRRLDDTTPSSRDYWNNRQVRVTGSRDVVSWDPSAVPCWEGAVVVPLNNNIDP